MRVKNNLKPLVSWHWLLIFDRILSMDIYRYTSGTWTCSSGFAQHFQFMTFSPLCYIYSLLTGCCRTCELSVTYQYEWRRTPQQACLLPIRLCKRFLLWRNQWFKIWCLLKLKSNTPWQMLPLYLRKKPCNQDRAMACTNTQQLDPL